MPIRARGPLRSAASAEPAAGEWRRAIQSGSAECRSVMDEMTRREPVAAAAAAEAAEAVGAAEMEDEDEEEDAEPLEAEAEESRERRSPRPTAATAAEAGCGE